MSEVILLSSSDDEDNITPPRKRIKPLKVLPECTLTPVAQRNGKSSLNKDEDDTVLLDSDENPENGCSSMPKENSIHSVKENDIVDLLDDEIELKKVINESLVEATQLKDKISDTVDILSDDSDTNLIIEEPKKNGSDDSSIIINDTDEEKENENHSTINDISHEGENDKVNNENSKCKEAERSKCKDNQFDPKASFNIFLELFEKSVTNSQFENIIPKKVPSIRRHFERCSSYVKQKSFRILLEECISKLTNSSASAAVIAFHKIYEQLKSSVGGPIEIKEEDIRKVKKLERTLKLLSAKIKQLEEAEVDWDEDEDSTYLQLDRYQSRFRKVYEKYCQYIEKNPYSGRLTYDKINFVTSSYNEINLAINRKYKNSLHFPSYYELEDYIKSVVEKEQLKLSDSAIKVESEKCFKELGGILQKRRKAELYDCHISFIEDSEDPAAKDPSLNNTLRKNLIEGEERIDKIFQKYVAKQDLGEDKELTNSKSSTSEEDEENPR